ncbi:MAG: hypothetical protein K5985_07275 [Lachnospiraceae bacterium]|nr:hypothetical protein [Lachnospiraceae bacterium]
MLEYLRKMAPRVLNRRSYFVIPAITEGAEKMLDEAPLANGDELSLMCRGYENVKKRRPPTKKNLEAYLNMTPRQLLGIDMMDPAPPVEGSSPAPDGEGLEEYYDEEMRKKCAVYERFWNKMEIWCIKVGLPSVMLMIQKLAADGYKMFSEGKAVSPGLRDLGFTGRPLSTSAERARMTAQVAGIIVLERELREKLEKDVAAHYRKRRNMR